MSGTDDGEKRTRGAGRSGSAGSIGKELGEDLDFEADALLDSLLSDVPPPAKPKSVAPSAPPTSPSPSEAPPPSEGPILHAPASREFPDDEPTWVGNIDAATGLELQALAAQLGLDSKPPAPPNTPASPAKPAEVLPPPAPPAAAAPAIPVLPPPPAFSPPRPAGVPRPGGVSSVPRPASRAPSRAATPSRGIETAQPPARELPTFGEDDEVTRVQGMPTLHDIDGMLERTAQEGPASVLQTARPPAGVQEAHIQTSAAPMEELALDDDMELPTSSTSAIDNLSDLSFEEPHDGIEELLDAPSEAPRPAADATEIGADELSAEELEALAAAEEEERRPSAPLSHTPPPPDLRSPQSMWPDERPAAAHLALDSDCWTERAEWLETEAHAASDPVAKARTLLVASEIWALVGDTARAREVATEANTMARSLPLVGRQLRALAAAEQDWKAVATALNLETRGAPTPEARVHAAYLNAEVHRLALKDDATGKKKLELAVRANVDDPRAHLSKLIDLLSKGTGPARMRWPESVALAELVQATEESSRLRGAPAPAGAPATTVSPSLALEQARKAFAVGERGATATAVARLAEIDGIGPSALWLAASLAAHEQKTRPEAIGWLERLLGGGADTLARRALAARALEQGSQQGIAAASEGETEAFAALDRAVLGALSGEGIETLGPLAQQLAQNDAQRPLAAGLYAAVSAQHHGELLAGSAAQRSAQLLGLSLQPAAGSEPSAATPHLRAPAERFAGDHPESPLGGAFALRFAQSDKQAPALLAGISFLAGGEQARDENLASALVEELSGSGEAAQARYAAALEADPRSPLALRALLASADRDGTVRLLGSAAEAAADPVQSALYLLEAALRLGPEDAERYDELLRKAAEALPSLSLIHRLGEQQARARGDAERLLGWLRARRAESQDALETALDLVREALLVAESDRARGQLAERRAGGSAQRHRAARAARAHRRQQRRRSRRLARAAGRARQRRDQARAVRTGRPRAPPRR